MKNICYSTYKCVIKISTAIFLLLYFIQPAFNQDSIVVEGKIMGIKNAPIAEVSVSIEGLAIDPAITDEEGKFEIKTPSADVWLIIDPIRKYKGKRIFLNNRENIVVHLAEMDVKSGFDDVPFVETAQNRRDILTSFTDIDLRRVEENDFISIDQSFQGIVPGMLTINRSGMPGCGAVSFLRGVSSMNSSNAPLIIVDGMPFENPGLFMTSIEGNFYNPLTSIEPYDISSVTILKDPIATSIYGTRASNGVILIETLDASATQTTINVSYRTGFNLTPDRLIPQLNANQYKTLANEILSSSPMKIENFQDDFPGLYISKEDDEYPRYMHNTNWQDLIFSNAIINDVYMSIKGGSEIATYGLSVGFYDHDGIIENTRYNRYNVGFVSDLNVFDWLKMKLNATLTSSNSYLRESSLSPQTSPILTSLFKPPILSPYKYDDTGQPLTILDDIDELGTSNPLAVVDNFIGENTNYRFISSIKGKADISDRLNFNTMLGINFSTMKEFVFMPNLGMEAYYNGEAHNVSQATNNHLFSFYTDNYLNFSDQFNTYHDINTTVGLRIQTNTYESDFGEALNLPENDQYTSLQSGQNELKNISGQNETWNWMSLYHQIKYKYKDKYLLNTGLSADFSTRTGLQAETAFRIGDYPFGLFYSIGGGWRISEERFLRNANWLENLMLRTSYGITGNDDIGNYNALNYYVLSLYRETSGLIPGGIANTSLKYEQINQLNLGLDLSIKGDKTRISIDYFVQTTEDMFIYMPLESYIGYDFKPENNGVVKNKGFELSLFHRIIDGERFKWDLHSTFTTVSNTVNDLNGIELVTSFDGGQFVTREGEPIMSFYGYNFEGVFADYAEAELAGLVNSKGRHFGAGDAKYTDFSGPNGKPDSVINEYDRVNLGSPTPKFFGSITQSFKYKRWSLSMLFQFVYGNNVFNYTRYLDERMVDLSNQSANTLTRWQYDGDETNVPRALWNDPIGNSDFSSRWIEDGSYARLKTLTLRYSIPEKFIVFKNANFFLTANNVMTLSNYLGYDPEFSYSSRPMQQGIDYSQMPQSRQFIIGVKLGL